VKQTANSGGLLVRMENIHKSFGAVKALKGVDFTVGRGEVVGLIGDNGAGKSTLIKILVGVYQPDEGEIYFDGVKVRWSSPLDARKSGIETVHQNLGLVDLMSISRNFFLGKEPGKYGLFLDKRKIDEESIRAIERFGIKLRDPNETVENLSGGERQSIMIAKAVYFGAKLLVLDEPTIALSVAETRKVIDTVERVRREGTSVIFISHNIRHVCDIADRFTILMNGEKIGDVRKGEATADIIEEVIATGRFPDRELHRI